MLVASGFSRTTVVSGFSRTTVVSGFSRTAVVSGFSRTMRVIVDFTKLDGLITAVIQDAATGEVLMVGFMNHEALQQTRESGFATFFSRSRQALWTKGETSGNRLAVLEVLVDCDEDTVLLKVKRLGDGNVCHTGQRSCFYRPIEEVKS